MIKSVQTHRLPATPEPGSSQMPLKRSSRPSSISLSLQTLNRLSCAPDDSAILSLALNTTTPDIPRPPITKNEYYNNSDGNSDDPLYEEIYSSVYSSHNGARLPPTDPPRLAPVSGVLHNKSPGLIRPTAFKPYVRMPTDLSSIKSPVSQCNSLPTVATNNCPMSSEKLEANLARKATGRSLSDPWKGSGCRKPIASILGEYKSRSTPSSVRDREDPGNGNNQVYYPSGSDKSSYGYVSASDQSMESLYGGNKTYHARMIRLENEDFFDDSFHMTSTPSPSDSGIAINYELLLKEKDDEIANLRNTMERNENVIFKVHEEKESSWRKQIDSLRNHYESLLHKSFMENQTIQEESSRNIEHLRQHNHKLHQQNQSAMDSKSSMEDTMKNLEEKNLELKTKLEEANWNICEKNGQISLLKKMRGVPEEHTSQLSQLQQKLESAQMEAFQRNVELKDLRNTLNFLTQELFQVQQKFDAAKEELDQRNDRSRFKRSSLAGGLLELMRDDTETERLKKEVSELKFKYCNEKQVMEEERALWLEEKEKVIKYQKQLQLNYLEIYKRNCSLETELDDINSSIRIACVDDTGRPDSVRESDC